MILILGNLYLLLPMVALNICIYGFALWRCRLGPDQGLADLLFKLLAFNAVILPILTFWSTTFWWTLLVYLALYILSFIAITSPLAKLLDDKTGFGAIMFPGWIAMMAFTAAAMARGIYWVYEVLFN